MVMVLITDLGGDNVNDSNDSSDYVIAIFVILLIPMFVVNGIHLNIY